MKRTSRISILAVWLALTPLSFALAGQPVLPGQRQLSAVVGTSMKSTPQAVFPETKFQFGPVFEGTEIKHDFVVENKGSAPLVINSIRPD